MNIESFSTIIYLAKKLKLRLLLIERWIGGLLVYVILNLGIPFVSNYTHFLREKIVPKSSFSSF
jgi:hypothetical protein